jgi:protein-disulfide isomerase
MAGEVVVNASWSSRGRLQDGKVQMIHAIFSLVVFVLITGQMSGVPAVRAQTSTRADSVESLSRSMSAKVAAGPLYTINKTINLQEILIRGPRHAPITIVEFSNFHCPFCSRVSPTLERLRRQYPGQIKRVFKHYPMPFDRRAILPHEAALAAGEQGKFWEMHDLLF